MAPSKPILISVVSRGSWLTQTNKEGQNGPTKMIVIMN